ncbi:astacin-like metalloprotease toxin 5 [Amblyomma americanum]
MLANKAVKGTDIIDLADKLRESLPATEAGYTQGDIIRLVGGGENHIHVRKQRSAAYASAKLWLGAVVPYAVDPSLTDQRGLGVIKAAMLEIEMNTCIRFVERSNQEDYVFIFSGQECYSYPGRMGGPQPLSLGHGCLQLPIVLHELLHALGFMHEHVRPDRDQYIKVIPENIKPQYLANFKKVAPDDALLFSSFDIESVMMYGSISAARSWSQPSIKGNDGSWIEGAYIRTGLSFYDVLGITRPYGCSARLLESARDQPQSSEDA